MVPYFPSCESHWFRPQLPKKQSLDDPQRLPELLRPHFPSEWASFRGEKGWGGCAQTTGCTLSSRQCSSFYSWGWDIASLLLSAGQSLLQRGFSLEPYSLSGKLPLFPLWPPMWPTDPPGSLQTGVAVLCPHSLAYYVCYMLFVGRFFQARETFKFACLKITHQTFPWQPWQLGRSS